MSLLILESSLFIAYIMYRAVKMNLANEGLEAKKKEEEVNAKKRKVQEDVDWEGEWIIPMFQVICAYFVV